MPYLDAQKDREVQALYSLQALVHRLEHPNKLLHSIFDVLYEVELISEDAFIEWEESTEVGEQEGQGVALKSCTQFFQWLRTAEEDDPEAEASPAEIAEDQQKEPVKFSIGGERRGWPLLPFLSTADADVPSTSWFLSGTVAGTLVQPGPSFIHCLVFGFSLSDPPYGHFSCS